MERFVICSIAYGMCGIVSRVMVIFRKDFLGFFSKRVALEVMANLVCNWSVILLIVWSYF